MIYTKQGDCGLSSTISANGIPKDDIIFDLLGNLDELGCCLGVARCSCTDSMSGKLEQIQLDLIKVSAHIAGGDAFNYKGTTGNYEVFIDSLEAIVDMPDCIVVSGGCDASAHIDLCRSVARRCERSAVTFVNKYSFDSCIVEYLNRLSDYLFMLGLFAKKL